MCALLLESVSVSERREARGERRDARHRKTKTLKRGWSRHYTTEQRQSVAFILCRSSCTHPPCSTAKAVHLYCCTHYRYHHQYHHTPCRTVPYLGSEERSGDERESDRPGLILVCFVSGTLLVTRSLHARVPIVVLRQLMVQVRALTNTPGAPTILELQGIVCNMGRIMEASHEICTCMI